MTENDVRLVFPAFAFDAAQSRSMGLSPVSRLMFAALAMLLMLFAASAASAQETRARFYGQAPYDSPYAGLLPDDFQLQTGTLDVAHLRQGKVVLIPSGNYNEYARLWSAYYEQGGLERDWLQTFAAGADGRRDQLDGMIQNSDPRLFASRLIDALRPYVREIGTAADLPTARAEGADYYLIVDTWLSGGPMRLRVAGGAYLLDGRLNSVISAQNTNEQNRNQMFVMSQRRTDENNARAMAAAMTGSSDAVIAQFIQALGPPPSESAPIER